MEFSCTVGGRKVPAVLVLVLITLCVASESIILSRPRRYDNAIIRSRRLMRIVPRVEPSLRYDGQRSIYLPAVAETLPVHIILYGNFSASQKTIVLDFFNSFESRAESEEDCCIFDGPPSVTCWWRPACGSWRVPSRVQLESNVSDTYSKGRNLSKAHVEELVLHHSLDSLGENPSALYIVLTSDDVAIEGFCTNSCASRSHVPVHRPAATGSSPQRVLDFAWVGNPATQCAEECAWPLGKPDLEGEQDLRPMGLVLSPNKDVGMDGMIINIAGMLAGAASMTPFRHNNNTHSFSPEGDITAASSSLSSKSSSSSSSTSLGLSEAPVVCRRVFGEGAYSGYAGHLWKEKITETSFNAVGANARRFLLPSLWDPVTQKCRIPS